MGYTVEHTDSRRVIFAIITYMVIIPTILQQDQDLGCCVITHAVGPRQAYLSCKTGNKASVFSLFGTFPFINQTVKCII